MAPGDDARAVLVVVGLAHHVGDLGVGLGGNFVDDFAGQIAGGVQLIGHLRRAGGDGLEDFRAVQKLTAHDEPKFIGMQHKSFLLL